jgi:hypothetical protein
MSSTDERAAAGGCLCGAIRFEAVGRLSDIQFCHCSRCRKSTGGPFLAALAARTKSFRWLSGEDRIAHYAAPILEAPPAYRRAFCSRCGAPVPIHDPEQPFVVIPAGCLDEDPGTRPFRHIFVGLKAPWYEIHDELPQFEGHVPPEQRLPRKPT